MTGPRGTRTVGIDIAGEQSPTGVCIIEWRASDAVVVHLSVGKRSLGAIVEIVREGRSDPGPEPVDWIGIDAPFGFPTAFTDAVIAMRSGGTPPEGDPRWRETEKEVRGIKQPLSSVTSLITNTVSGRCFPLRVALCGPAASTDLIGYESHVVEVYPAAALSSWGIEVRVESRDLSYKRKGHLGEGPRSAVLAELAAGAPWLQIGAVERSLMLQRDDAIDALVSALVARVVARADRPTDPRRCVQDPERLATLGVEGWIHVPPTGSLEGLPSTAL